MSYEPPWLRGARRDMDLGVLEIAGPEHHWRILEYHARTGLHASTDEVAWCASAVCAWLEESGVRSTRSARARSYLGWGIPIKTPALGCVVIIKRGGTTQPGPKNHTAQGHVGLLVDCDADSIDILGGNQSNRVCIKSYPLDRLLGYRWPE